MFQGAVRRNTLISCSSSFCRALSTLQGSSHVYVFPDHRSLSNSLLTLLPTEPPNPQLAIGSTSRLPPTPDSLRENPRFLSILHAVLRDHAHTDPLVTSQAKAHASSAGSTLGSGGAGGAGGASAQGGAGGGGCGGYIHVSDLRNPPDYGRIAWPEDIFGSLEVDSEGNFVDGHGHYQESGTYRVLTREGILGLSPFLLQKLVDRLKVEEQREK